MILGFNYYYVIESHEPFTIGGPIKALSKTTDYTPGIRENTQTLQKQCQNSQKATLVDGTRGNSKQVSQNVDHNNHVSSARVEPKT